MYSTPTLSTRFARTTRVLRSDAPLSEDQMRTAAPSIFAEGRHASRSERYSYIPTIDVLRGLRQEGFEPFMVVQGASRIEGKAAFTKHMIRMRHATELRVRDEANEVILINSHDGTSSYQMLAGAIRFACHNGLVVGDITNDVRVPHKGDVRHRVIEGAFKVLDEFGAVQESIADMKALTLLPDERQAFAEAALTLRYGDRSSDADGGRPPPPVTAEQLASPRRPEDDGPSLWQAFQSIQENCERGGLPSRSVTGRRTRTRPIASIDGSVQINRALWVLAEAMRKLKA